MSKRKGFLSLLVLGLFSILSPTAMVWAQGRGPWLTPGNFRINQGSGILDIATTLSGSNRIEIFLGEDGQGTFCYAGFVDLTGRGIEPHSVTVGDFNMDDVPDIAVTTLGPGTGRVLIFLGFGTASCRPRRPDFVLSPVQPLPDGLNQPEFVVVEDFNGDRRPDLAVANQGSNNVSIILNMAGSFPPPLSFPVGTTPSSIAVGDFDNDGKPDLAVANKDSNNVSILRGNGDGTFGSATNIAVGTAPLAIVAKDFDGDGCPDLATANSGSNTVSILMGTSVGTTCTGLFSWTDDLPVGDSLVSIVVGDFNNDGYEDLAVTNYAANTVSVLSGNGDGTFSEAQDYSVGMRPVNLIAGRLTSDADISLATGNNMGSNNLTILVNDQGEFVARIDCGFGGCTKQ